MYKIFFSPIIFPYFALSHTKVYKKLSCVLSFARHFYKLYLSTHNTERCVEKELFQGKLTLNVWPRISLVFVLLIHGPRNFQNATCIYAMHICKCLPCVWYECSWHHKYKVWENGIVSIAIVRENLNQDPKRAHETDASYPFQTSIEAIFDNHLRVPPWRKSPFCVGIYCNRCARKSIQEGALNFSRSLREHKIKRSRT